MLGVNQNEYTDDEIEKDFDDADNSDSSEEDAIEENFKEDNADIFGLYLSDMGKIDLITVEEEKRLGKIIQDFLKEEERIFGLLINGTIKLSGNKKIESNNNNKLLLDSIELKKQISKPDKVRLGLEKNRTKLFRNIKYGYVDLVMTEDKKTTFYKMREDGEYAINKFATANLRLVVKIASEYKGRLGGLNFSDLIQVGNIGLLKAVKKFNPESENKFSTYAVWWIKQAITSTIQSKSKTIYIPKKREEKLYTLLKVKKIFRDKKGRFPTNEELAKELQVSNEEILELLYRVSPLQDGCITSIDSFIGDSDSFTLRDTLENNTLNPEQEYHKIKVKEVVDKILLGLNEKEKSIINLRFGLNGNEEHTLLAIGKKFGVTREAIRQNEAKLILKLNKKIGLMQIKEDDIF